MLCIQNTNSLRSLAKLLISFVWLSVATTCSWRPERLSEIEIKQHDEMYSCLYIYELLKDNNYN